MLNNQEEILKFENNVEISVSDRKSPRSFPLHWHDMAEFVIALKDDCHFRVGDDMFVLNENEILLIWPRELHEVVSTPIEATALLQFPSYLIDSEAEIAPYQSMMQSHHLITPEVDEELHRKLVSYLKQSISIYVSEDSFFQTELKIFVFKILLALAKYSIKEVGFESSDAYPSEMLASRIQAACSFIVHNCSQNISQSDVADYIGLSRYYFSRIFKNYMNTSFNDYLSTQRINLATKLLADNTLSISEAAFQSGFQSISNFNKVFKKKTGRSPKEYRTLIVQD